jgi:hypothetical protein
VFHGDEVTNNGKVNRKDGSALLHRTTLEVTRALSEE